MSLRHVFQWGLICVLFAGVGAARPVAEGQTSQRDGGQELKELRDANHALQVRNDLLEKRNRELAAQVKQLQTQLSAMRVLTQPAPMSPAPQQLPEGWRRGEFNGLPVYLIPLDTGAAPTTRPTR